jgi:hypothetical protein
LAVASHFVTKLYKLLDGRQGILAIAMQRKEILKNAKFGF